MKNRNATEPTTPICWQREAPSPCLRVELENGDIQIFPYNHLVSARLTGISSDTETLLLAFSSHEVQIEGRNLRELVLGIQDFAIKWLRAVPERYQAIASGRNEIIVSIRVAASE
jgi:hypothetical protein